MPATMNATERLLFEDLIRMNEITRRNERLQQQAEQSGANIEASGNTGGLNRDMWARPSDVGVQYNMSTTHNQTWDHNLLERDTILPNDMNQPLASLPMFMLQLNPNNNSISSPTLTTTHPTGYPVVPPSSSFVGHGQELSSPSSIAPAFTYHYPEHMGNVGGTDSPGSIFESSMLSSEWHSLSSQHVPQHTVPSSDMLGASWPQLYEAQPQQFHPVQAVQQSYQPYEYEQQYHGYYQQQATATMHWQDESISGSFANFSSPDSQDDAQIASSGGKAAKREGGRGPRGPYKKKTDAAEHPGIRACPMTGCLFATDQESRALRRHIESCEHNPNALGYMCLGVHDLANQTPCNTPLGARKDTLIAHANRIHRQHMSSTGMQLHFKVFPKSALDPLRRQMTTSEHEYERGIVEFLRQNESVHTEALAINTNPDEPSKRFNTVAAHFLY